MSDFQRSGHKIKLNHSNALPRYLLSIYVESERDTSTSSTVSIANVFKSASITSGRFVTGKFVGKQTTSFVDRVSLWQNIMDYTRPNYTTWIVGYNVLPQLILCGLPNQFQTGEISIDRPRSKRKREDNDEENVHQMGLAVIESPPTIIGCRVSATQGRLVIVDLANWFPGEQSTGKAAEGFAALIDNAAGHNDVPRRRETERYSESLHKTFETLIQWVKDNELGTFRYTASSQAYGAYRHRFMEKQIYVHDNEAIQELERRSYYGGRSEAFRLGSFGNDVFQLDVSGLFPSVMRSWECPYRLLRSEQREELIELEPAIDWSASCANVEIVTDKPLYPFRSDTNVIFPIGRFRTTLCGNELYTAHKRGDISKVGTWAEYKLAPLFNMWVDTLWAMRQNYRTQGNLLYEQFTKRIMNSLYGKFAQLTPAWINLPNDFSMLPWTTEQRHEFTTGEWTKYRSIGWQVQKNVGRKVRPQSFYAISAFVTAAARSRMDFLRHIAGRDNVYYQGVDSLIVSRAGYDRLQEQGEVADNELGKLRLQYQSDHCVIRGISDYEIGSRKVLSSRALNYETTPSGETLQHRYYVMNNLFKNGPIDTIQESIEKWQRHSKYSKGIVGQDGWTAPFELSGSPTSARVGVGSADAAEPASCSSNGL